MVLKEWDEVGERGSYKLGREGSFVEWEAGM